MSETTIEPESVKEPAGGAMPSAASDEQLVAMQVDRARSEGLRLTGDGGPPSQSPATGRHGLALPQPSPPSSAGIVRAGSPPSAGRFMMSTVSSPGIEYSATWFQ